jgi:hypothetical protein
MNDILVLSRTMADRYMPQSRCQYTITKLQAAALSHDFDCADLNGWLTIRVVQHIALKERGMGIRLVFGAKPW